MKAKCACTIVNNVEVICNDCTKSGLRYDLEYEFNLDSLAAWLWERGVRA